MIIEDVREIFRRGRQVKTLEHARACLSRGDSAPMQQIAQSSVGDAWLELAEFYADQGPESAQTATGAFRHATQSRTWYTDNYGPAKEEYDRRRFLGIGTVQDFALLAREWKTGHLPGYERETQLAWIFSCGPEELGDPKEAWWWVAMAEARWGRLQDAELPTFSAAVLRERLMQSTTEEDRLGLQTLAKASAHEEFVAGK